MTGEERKAYHRGWMRSYRASRPDKLREVNARAYKKRVDTSPEWALWKNAQRRAKRDGVEFNLTFKDIVIPELCPYLGVRLERGHPTNAPSIDRIDPKSGYTPHNVRVVSRRANVIKNDASAVELETIAAALRRLEK